MAAKPASTSNPLVDAYIAKSAAFAQPILTTLRAIVHEACPALEEDIKWGMPFFSYRGILCNMAAFAAAARRDYIEWLTEAKRPATRAARIATAVEWIVEGKTRHWKYKR